MSERSLSTRTRALALGMTLAAGATQAGPIAETWGQFGKVAYRAAAAAMKRRNGEGVPLTAFQKGKLRPLFGSLVDRVTVAYDCQMLEEWKIGPWTVRFGVPSGGQTFGHRIYIHRPHRPGSLSQTRLLAHELVHSLQFERFGSTLSAFGYQYFKEYYLGGRDYRNNLLEREAYDFPVPFERGHARELAFLRLHTHYH